MATRTVRNILEEVRRADAVKPEQRLRLGDALAALGRRIGLTDEEFAILDSARDKTPVEPMMFE